jgi:hypothetical protein
MQQLYVPSDMSGKHITVVTMSDPPFVTQTNAPGTPLSFDGFCIDMLHEISTLANVSHVRSCPALRVSRCYLLTHSSFRGSSHSSTYHGQLES